MHEQHSNPEYLALLAEEITPEELRALLRRLGEQEFGDPKPTVGAVVEATGADAFTVASLLADIRHTHFHDRIQKALLPTELRVTRLEQRTEELDDRLESLEFKTSRQTPPVVLEEKAIPQQPQDFDDTPIVVLIVVVCGLLFLIGYLISL